MRFCGQLVRFRRTAFEILRKRMKQSAKNAWKKSTKTHEVKNKSSAKTNAKEYLTDRS